MNLKKIFAGVTTVTCSVMMIGGAAIPAFALTVEELEAQIAELQAQLQLYMSQLDDLEGDDDVTTGSSYDGIPDGFTFENALYYGMNNTEVQYLQIILKSEIGAPTYPDTVGATGFFGGITKASVIEFQEKYADDILATYGLTSGTGYVGTTTRAKLNELLQAQPPVPDDDDDTADDDDDDDTADDDDDDDDTDDGDYSVELSDDNPSATTLMDESAYNEMLTFEATADDGDWDISSITVERFGISTDAMVGGVLIKDSEGSRHGNVYTFSDKEAEIVFENYPISIEEGNTETISVFYNLGSTATSGTIGAKITAINGDPDGLPLVGNTFTLASGGSVLGALTVDVVNVATTAVSVDVGTDNKLLTKFQFTESTSNEDVYIEELTIYNNGSSADGDVLNWELRDPQGNTLAEVAQTDDKYVTLDLTNSPGYRIPNGSSKTLSLYVDVADGSSRTTQAVILDDYDVVAIGKDTDTRILATGANVVDTSTFPVGDIASGSNGYNTITAAAGSLTVSKSNTSPTGTVAAGGSDVLFGVWNFKASGEDMEIRRLDIYATRTAPDNGDSGSTANEADDVFTGTVKLKTDDGVTRKSLTVADNVPATAATAYTLSSYFTIPAGETVEVSIYGNLRTDLSSADSFQFGLDDVYYKRLSTGDFQTYGTAKTANTLTGAAGSLSVVKDSAWGNKSVIADTNKQIGQFVIQTGSTEGVNVSSLTVDITSIAGLDEMWLQKGTGDCDESSSDLIGSVDTSPAATDNIYSTGGDFEIPESGSQTFIVCGNFDSNLATGTYQTSLNASDVSATGATSGESVTNSAAATGQIMTIQTAGVLTVKVGSNPAAQVLRAGESGVQLLDLTFGSLYEPITIDTFRFSVEDDGSQDRNFTNYTLKNGSTVQSGKSSVSGVITFSGLSETIDYYDSETYSLWADVSDILTIGQDDNARVKFASVEAIGDWSNSNILESDEFDYLGAVTTEPGSTSSVGHYQQGDLVVSIDNGTLQPVMAETNEAVSLTVTGLDLGDAANETFTTSEEVSKFGAYKQAPHVGATLTDDTTADFFIFADASGSSVTAGMITADDTIDGSAITPAAGDIAVELTGTGEIIAATEFDTNQPAVGAFVYYYDATGANDGYGVVTTAWADNGAGADTVSVNATAITAAAGDGMFDFNSDVSQEVYSTSSTYQYGVGDVVYHYDASAASSSGWGVVTTGIRAGETMANLVTSIATAAASDRVVKFSPGVLASNVMNMHDAEPIITASDSTYATSIVGSMQTLAIFDIEAIGGDVSVESLAVRLEGSGVGQLSTSSNAFEIWEGNERIYQGGDVSGAAAATYTCDLTNPEEIQEGETKTFTVKLNTAGTWTSTQVGMSLTGKVNGVKGQSGSGLDWFYTNSQGAGTVPSSTSPVSITDSELPVSGKHSLTY